MQKILPQQTFSIRRRIEIDAAHRVPHHGSKCFNMHGHRYIVEAVCAGDVIGEGEQTGMVMDFSFLKACMMDVIYNPCDHGTIFYKDDPVLHALMKSVYPTWMPADLGAAFPYGGIGVPGWKLYIIDRVPTAENLAAVWFHELQQRITQWFQKNEPDVDPPTLVRLDVWETPNCVASYPAEGQEFIR